MSPVLLSRLEKDLGLTRPSAVQVATYNAIAEAGDVMIGAEAGRGKTSAIPLAHYQWHSPTKAERRASWL